MSSRVFPQSDSVGALFVGVEAVTPTGTVNVTVADFTGTTEILRAAPSVAIPVTHAPSITAGSRFHINIEGQWLVRARVTAQTAASVRAAIGYDNVAGDLIANPLPPNFTTYRDMALRIAAAGDTDPMHLEALISVTRDQAQDQVAQATGNVRLFLSNNTAAAPAAASINAPFTWISFERIGDLGMVLMP